MKLRYVIIAGVIISIGLVGISGYLYVYMSNYFNFFLFRKGGVSVQTSPITPEVLIAPQGIFGLYPEQTIALLVSLVFVMLCFLVGIYFYIATNSARAHIFSDKKMKPSALNSKRLSKNIASNAPNFKKSISSTNEKLNQ